jgi:hypothetical protein
MNVGEPNTPGSIAPSVAAANEFAVHSDRLEQDRDRIAAGLFQLS